ncbi:DUF4349 domain-containing protein [Adhaeribacter pallidiroseus]|uniref:DUF4349 domain-containing protein n=1 Tax=Adhaeribacter pallidiroseus TaxID=2072847 RepID=A0A369QFH1_9BACT|nr:DUF4349 domain-containing protein [Adhaeribacter pallidiroseus]RDC63671.1 hypothetical protein AHMF7616_02279 [Adhaeribacter pallidiroseus]
MKKTLLSVKYITVLLIWVVTISCESQTIGKVEQSEGPVVSSPAMDTSYGNAKLEAVQVMQEQAAPPTNLDQKIIRKATLRFQVADFRKSAEVINQIIPQFQGQLLSANENRTENTLESNSVIKVLPQQFEPLIAKLAEQSIYLDSKNITSEDVTTEYIDIAARLKTKKAVELRYLDLLQQARTVKDIIAVENQLRQIQEEIESTEARITYLSRQTSYNTIELTYYQKLGATSSPDTSFAVRVRNALQGGWDVLLGLLIGLIHLWPLLLIFPVLFIYLRWFLRKYSTSRSV